jgi:transcriptional regulator with XRE-family HTH domain
MTDDTGSTAQPEPSFAVQLRRARERAGKSRAVLGGLVGRSEEWVKALETGKQQMPRLPMLLRLAEVLRVEDLAELTGGLSMPVQSLSGKASHEQLPRVAGAMLAKSVSTDREPDLSGLERRVDEAWQRWVHQPNQKSAVAEVLPGLLTEGRSALRALDGMDRRRAQVHLSRTYSLAQCFFAFQPATELVWLAADRAMLAADEADDPLALATAAWYYAALYRSAGQVDRALAEALDGAALLDPATGVEQRARWGHLQLSAALSEATVGNAGNAWRHWDRADEAATVLGRDYYHPWLRFGRADVDANAIWIENRLFRPGEALRRADALDLSAQPGPHVRAQRLLDFAEAHNLRSERADAIYMIRRAHHESPETVKFSLSARAMLVDLSERRSSVRQDARELAALVGIGA